MQSLPTTCLALAIFSCVGLPAHAGTPQKKTATSHSTPAQKPAPKPPEKKPEPKPEAKPAPKAEAPKQPTIGDEVDGAIALTDTAAKPHTLREYRGKALVIAMWSIDSATCKTYQDRLKKLTDEYSAKGVTVIAVDPNGTDVDAGADPYKRMKDYSSKSPIGAALLADPEGKLGDKLNAHMTPEVFLIDAKGVLRYKGAIDDDPKGEKGDKANAFLRKALDEMLAGKPVANSSTTANGEPIKRAAASKSAEPAKKPEEKPAPPKKG